MSKKKQDTEDCLACAQTSRDNIFYLQLHLTQHCNLRCTHCYIEKPAGVQPAVQDRVKELQPAEILDIIDQFDKFVKLQSATAKIYFTGGEPLLDPRLPEYISAAAKRGMITMILSNGTLIDDEKAKELRHAGLRIVQISIDGLEATHDAIRGPGNFARATRALDVCHAAGMGTTAMVTISKLNASEIEGIVDHSAQHHVTRFALGRLVPEGNGLQLQGQVLSRDELKVVFSKIKRLQRKYKGAMDIAIHDPIWMTFTGVKNTHGCSAGKSGICIVENGDIMPCRRMDYAIGNIREISLAKAWYSGKLDAFRFREGYEGHCGSCKFLEQCGGCRAVARAASGGKSPLAEDPQCFLYRAAKDKGVN
nr:radical SAM protein [Candidatus Sigynarchaeota archaeon]